MSKVNICLVSSSPLPLAVLPASVYNLNGFACLPPSCVGNGCSCEGRPRLEKKRLRTSLLSLLTQRRPRLHFSRLPLTSQLIAVNGPASPAAPPPRSALERARA